MSNNEPEYEYVTKTLGVSDKIVDELKALEAEGWELTPGAHPVAVYNLRRVKQKAAAQVMAAGGLGKLAINDDEVWVLKADGRRVRGDGSDE